MIIWGSVLLRRTVCGDIDWHWHHQSQLAWPWWWIRSGCGNVSQCHHKHSFSGLHSPGQPYFTNLWYDSWVQTFYKITTGLNFHFHLRPTFTQKALCTVACIAGEVGKGEGERAREKSRGLAPRHPFFSRACSPSPFPTSPATQAMHTAVAVYEFHVTRNCFWAGFLSKSVSFRVILLKIVHKHAGIYSSIIKLLFPAIILWLCRPNIFFFTPTLSNMLLPKIPRSWRCCMVIPKENIVSICFSGACVMMQKKEKNPQKTEI